MFLLNRQIDNKQEEKKLTQWQIQNVKRDTKCKEKNKHVHKQCRNRTQWNENSIGVKNQRKQTKISKKLNNSKNDDHTYKKKEAKNEMKNMKNNNKLQFTTLVRLLLMKQKQ